MQVPALLSNFSQNNLIRQRHPYSFYHGPNPLALIVGTAPPQRFCKSHDNLKMNSITANAWCRKEPPIKKNDKDWYYGSSANPFWSIMFKVFECDQNVTKRQFLNKYKLGITDILLEFYRVNNSDSDQYLFPIKFKSVFRNCRDHTSIKRIFTTSVQAKDWLYSSLAQHKSVVKIKVNGFSFVCQNFNDKRKIEVIVLPSPSGATRKSRDELIESYKNLFKEHKNDLKKLS